MRRIGLFVAGAAIMFMLVAWVEGQQEEKKKGGFGGFGGGFGGGQRQDAVTLLRNAAVKKELDLTDEQLNKLPAEVLNAIAKVLNEKQMARFRQIELQQRGNDVFKDEAVQKTLNINPDQRKSISAILETSSKELAELAKGGDFKDFKGRTEKRETIRKETKEKIDNVLTADQRKSYTVMLGEELKLNTGFGGFGGGTFKKGNKKKDIQ